ncbi:methyl-accepting chemotaxis protein [Dactylosporangium aurantiacum]|uniref:Methyl-accepting chemotaxis protein n=2 Tax=Dactylosporangium aurantiacum TaxID=35754 RepID=A0A9Q9IUZ3_9ACTN|nr:methyl-accepting chemotaxis protein [Dactylosporangium aurantiacum]
MLVCAVAGAGIGFAAGRRRTGGWDAAAAVLRRAAAGDLTGRVLAGADPQVAAAVNGTLDRVAGIVRQVAAASGALTDAGRQLGGVVEEMLTSAERSVAASQRVLDAARDVHAQVTSVADGAKQLDTSIGEISRSSTEAATVAADAVRVTDATGRTMTRLGDSSSEIGAVIKVITSIAEQTNLLALNATIESARAGAMGKGFAVVASEVKDLAQETATATEDITRRIAALQSDTTGAVQAIGRITDVIGRVSGYQSTIARAVELQSSTTAGMSGGIGRAATGAAEIADTMTAVAAKRKEAHDTVLRARDLTTRLDRLTTDLAGAVSGFTIG